MYAAIGLLGGSIFAEPWQGIVAAVVLIVLLTRGAAWLRRRREAREAVSG